MKYLFFLLGLFFWLCGFGYQISGTSAVHEAAAFLLYLNGTVFIVGSGIMSAIRYAADLIRGS